MAVRSTALEADIRQAEIIEQYRVGMATVYITSDARYLIQEPRLPREEHEICSRINERLAPFLQPPGGSKDKAEWMHDIEERIWREAQRIRRADRVSDFFAVLKYYVMRDAAGYGLLDVPFSDDMVGEIFVDGRGIEVAVTHRNHREFGLLDTNIVIGDDIQTGLLVSGLARKIGRTEPARPIMEGITDQKHRVTIAYVDAAPSACPAITVSKFQATPPAITGLLLSGTLSRLEAAYLWMLNDACATGLVAGGRGSGKTALLNSIATMSNPRWRVITIEQVRALRVPHRHAMSFDIGPLDGPARLVGLAGASRWMRPDLLLVDCLTAEEAHEVFRSAQNGQALVASTNCHDIDSLLCGPAGPCTKSSPRTMPWYAASMSQFRTPDGKYAPRMTSLVEFDPSRKAPSGTELFCNSRAAAGRPEGIEGILKKSRLAGHAAKILGVDPLADLQSRIRLLDECLEKRAEKIEDAFEILKKYYLPDRIAGSHHK
ncbi:MAG: type II/IV secretion system ATPase subunit [Thaumarchaeota archaeon]|nr:type II/IV secretion system ATPase subunit [Nitrososphaerota archaeon]